MGCGSAKLGGVDSLRRGITFLPSQDPDPKKRAEDIVDNRNKYYTWTYGIPGVPPFLPSVPEPETSRAATGHHVVIFKDIIASTISMYFNKTFEFFDHAFTDEKPFERYRDIFTGSPIRQPLVIDDWSTDECFARQRIVGVNPTLIRRIDKAEHPVFAKMPITDAHVPGVLPAGYTIRRLVDEGRLFVCDYELLQTVIAKCPPERHTTAPVALFFSDPSQENTLMPLAIQLSQDPTKSPIFHPKDMPGVWLAAKIHVQVADANQHEVEAHLFATHIIMEAAYTTMRRHMHPNHPLVAWLQENFFYTLQINASARSDLIAPKGPVPTLMSLGYDGTVALFQESAKTWDWKRFDVELSVERRGLGDTTILPGNYWRDDALRLWRAIKKFAGEMIDCIYKSDADVVADGELQEWLRELTNHVGLTGCGFRGVPFNYETKCMESLTQLKHFVTMLVYTASAWHSTVNNGQYDYLGFVPNSPGTFKMEPVTNKNVDIPMAAIAGAMPNRDMSILQVSFVHLLSIPTEDPLGSYNAPFFRRPDIAACVSEFQRELTHLSDAIRARNANLKHPYTLLDPKQISQGIAI